jgi:hypothetical protein
MRRCLAANGTRGQRTGRWGRTFPPSPSVGRWLDGFRVPCKHNEASAGNLQGSLTSERP